MKTVKCSVCGRKLPEDQFRRDSSTPLGYKQPCRACHAERERNTRQGGTAEPRTTNIESDSPLLGSAALKSLRGGSRTPKALAAAMGVGEKQAEEVVSALRERGYQITLADDGRYRLSSTLLPVQPFKRIHAPVLTGNTVEIGVVADSHMCNVHERLDVLEAAYDEFASRKITTVLHAGNIVDGYLEKINGPEVKFHRMEDQAHYCIDHYPQRDGIVTRYLSTYCHEGWWRGVSFGHFLELEARSLGRSDLEHLGLMEADIPLSSTANMRIVHPRDGCAYATSYPAQKHVEAYGEGEKPRLLVMGHYHKQGFFVPRGVATLLAPCACDQTGYMRGKRIRAEVGYVVLRVTLDRAGSICGITPDIRQFWNKPFYAGMAWEDVRGARK